MVCCSEPPSALAPPFTRMQHEGEQNRRIHRHIPSSTQHYEAVSLSVVSNEYGESNSPGMSSLFATQATDDKTFLSPVPHMQNDENNHMPYILVTVQ